jgi:HTH-type transcriptional regulator, sugar sensing transcriptional regulator
MKKQILSDGLIKALLQLDLTEKEIASYSTLLEKGALSIQDISRQTGINRVTTYAAIEELKQKGLVAESRKGKRKLLVAEDPECLINLITEKKEKINKEEVALNNIILPALKAININQENKPEIKFFEGEDGINKVFDEYILKTNEAINCGSYDTAIKVMSENYEEKYFTEIKKRKIFYRMILEDTPLNHRFAEIGRGIAHTKFLPAETKISADIVVFGGKYTTLISYDRKTATLIEDKSIAEAIKMYLDFMWERL